MRLRRYHTLFGLAVVCVACGVLALSAPGSAYTAQNLILVDFAGYGDQIYNYDFSSESATSTNVEWPIDLVFYNNATINGVKNMLSGTYWVPGSEEYARLNNRYMGTGWVWDSDGGEKTGVPTCWTTTKHYRIYAPSSLDAFYNPAYGFYVVGSTHEDIDEIPGCDAHYNYSEAVEQDIANIWRNLGHTTYYDDYWFANQQYDLQGNHHFDSDGYATYLHVPS